MALIQLRRQMMLRMKHILTMTALLICLTALPVLAQDSGTTNANANTSDPIGTLVILGGLVAIFVVGGVIYMRENGKNRKEVD
jgi:hypothetical protein